MSTQPPYQRSYTLRFTITAGQEYDLPEHIADAKPMSVAKYLMRMQEMRKE